MLKIVDLTADMTKEIDQAAGLLVDLLPENSPDMEAGLKEVGECLKPGKIARVAVEGEMVVGWIGAWERYDRHLWELHPLVVRRERQRQGIGRALVADIEEHVRARGAHTMIVAADYREGVDLYATALNHLQGGEIDGEYQYKFYERCGYVIVGVVPDAKGFSNIYMAKRMVPPDK